MSELGETEGVDHIGVMQRFGWAHQTRKRIIVLCILSACVGVSAWLESLRDKHDSHCTQRFGHL